jgi:hypothetical protein
MKKDDPLYLGSRTGNIPKHFATDRVIASPNDFVDMPEEDNDFLLIYTVCQTHSTASVA